MSRLNQRFKEVGLFGLLFDSFPYLVVAFLVLNALYFVLVIAKGMAG